MQFAEKFMAISSVGLGRMDYLALPVAISSTEAQAEPAASDDWNEIKGLLFDEEAKSFAETASNAGVPAPDENDIGYEIEGENGEVIATVEIAWPINKICFMTEEQIVDREKVEALGWKILSLCDVADTDIAKQFGGDGK